VDVEASHLHLWYLSGISLSTGLKDELSGKGARKRDEDRDETMIGGLLLISLGFTSPPSLLHGVSRTSSGRALSSVRMEDVGPLDTVKKGWGRFQESRSQGYGVKQAIADAIAGDYDVTAVQEEVQEEAKSSPLVLFTWEASPSCKKALELLEIAGADPKVIRLDQPWSEGNKKRAALGRLTGKSSVPSVWIGGKYVGGCDDGPSDSAPGLVKLAFMGKLKDLLEDAGALKARPALPQTEAVTSQ